MSFACTSMYQSIIVSLGNDKVMRRRCLVCLASLDTLGSNPPGKDSRVWSVWKAMKEHGLGIRLAT